MFSIIKRIIRWCGRRKYRLYWGFLFCFFEATFIAAPIMGAAYLLSLIIDSFNTGIPLDPVWTLYALVFMIVMVGARAFFAYLKAVFQESIAFELTEEERIKIGDILKRVSLGFFQSNRTGDLSTAVSTDLSFIEMYSMNMIASVVNAYIMAAVMVLALAVFSPPIALAVFVAVVLSLVFLTILGKHSKRNAPTHRKTQDDMVSATLEYVRGMPVVKAYGKAGASSQAIQAAFRNNRKINIGIELSYAPINSLHLLSLDLGTVAIVAIGAILTLQGTMPLSIFLMMAMFAFSMFGQISRVNDSVHTLENIDVIMDKLDLIKNAELIDGDSRDISLDRFDIELEGVSFAYGDTSQTQDYYAGKAFNFEKGKSKEVHDASVMPSKRRTSSRTSDYLALEDVTLTIPEGSTTAIVGPSGSGKSTICSLIMRFYDVTSGTIRIGGVDVREVTCDGLLRYISTVFQNVYLFNDTVANNIAFGKPQATREEIIEAAKQARCHDFIVQLPKGYDTVIGEGGGTLSGGEKQRVSIARALLKDAPIIILDEATASIDPENEHLVQGALAELTRGKTVIVIAHRLQTIEHADHIVVLDEGRIVQEGKHQSLIDQEGIYRRFVDIRQRAENWVIA